VIAMTFARAAVALALLSIAAEARARDPLPCPSPAPLALSSGSWSLDTPCPVASVSLSGSADVLVTGPILRVSGPITLSGDAVLTITAVEFVLAQLATAQFPIVLRDRSALIVEGVRVITNGGVAASPTAFLYAFGDAQVRFTDASLDPDASWLLAYLNERSRLRVENGAHVPTEIYPRDDSTVEITGPDTTVRTVLLIPPHATARIEGLPATSPFSHRFGRGEPGSSGVGYLVDVQESTSRFGVSIAPMTDVTLRDNERPLTLSYLFMADAAPNWLAGLRSGMPVTQTLEHQGRHLSLESTLLYDVGWQVYLQRVGGPAAPFVAIDDSWINELGALSDSHAEARDSVFQFAYLSAFESGTRVRVEDSVINSQNVRASDDGVVEIVESQIWGSHLDVSDQGRLRLVNVDLEPNQCHAACLPACLGAGGTCNAFNAAAQVAFDVRDQGAVLGARLAPISAPVSRGALLPVRGDVYVVSTLAALAASAWDLSAVDEDGGETPIASGGAAIQLEALLGTLDTSPLAAGDYRLRLELAAPGEAPLVAERFLRVVDPP